MDKTLFPPHSSSHRPPRRPPRHLSRGLARALVWRPVRAGFRPQLWAGLGAWLIASAGVVHAQTLAPAAQDAWVAQALRFATQHLSQQLAAAGQRSEVLPGALDARLRLAACDEVRPYLPTGSRLWGRSRIGLRCVKGPTPWNVYLPVTVKVYGPAWVAAGALPNGHVLAAGDLRQMDVDLADNPQQPPLTELPTLLGRTLSRPLTPGQAVHESALQARQWFTAGERVSIRVAGNGFAIAGAGEALTAGREGQAARVRTESGRVVSGMPVAERVLEITL